MSQSDTPLAGLVELSPPPAGAVALDDVDLSLLRLLADDARASQRGLARQLGMSAPAIGERLARMERTGVIRGYSVVLDWAAAGFPVVIYLAVTAAQGHALGPVLAEVSSLPEVENVTVVTGDRDLLVRLRVRDYAHLRTVLLEKVWQISGVQRTETYLSIAEGPPKNFAAELIESLRVGDGVPAPVREESA